jgi:hypothetical protein
MSLDWLTSYHRVPWHGLNQILLPCTRVLRYELDVSENTLDIGTIRQIKTLSKSLGGLIECKRLGFVYEDDNGVLSLSSAGLGYLCS